MKSPLLFGYQLLTGLSDFSTGISLIMAPSLTMRLMRLHLLADATPFLSLIGAFVLSVGLCCLYGAWIVHCEGCTNRLETVWLLTAIIRGSVAIFITAAIINGSLEPGWLAVAIFDGSFALIQATGLRKGWLSRAAR